MGMPGPIVVDKGHLLQIDPLWPMRVLPFFRSLNTASRFSLICTGVKPTLPMQP